MLSTQTFEMSRTSTSVAPRQDAHILNQFPSHMAQRQCYKPVGELVCALRGFPWTVTICDKWHRRPHDHKFRNICCPEIWSFEIFQDGGRPNLAFGTTGSRSIQSAVPENPTLGSNTKLIGRPVPEMWPFEIFQDGGQPPSWIWWNRK